MVPVMLKTKLQAGILALSILPVSLPSFADHPSEKDWAAFNNASLEEHILPRYVNLTAKSETLKSSTEAFCANPGDETLSDAQKDTVRVMMAWQAIEHVGFGPVTWLMRDFGMQFWPDRKGIGAKQLRQALKLKDTAFDETFFLNASVSLQGLPALERLLFDNEVLNKLADNPAVCQLSEGIAQNIHRVARGIEADWRQVAEEIRNAEYEEGEFEDTFDVATQILKSLVEPIEAIRDDKISRALGDSVQKARWKKSEFWRSGQSVNSLRVNVQALQHLYMGWDDHSVLSLLHKSEADELAIAIADQFKFINITLADLHEPSPDQITEEQYTKLTELAEQLRLLQKTLEQAMTPLDIHLGFNSRDGD